MRCRVIRAHEVHRDRDGNMWDPAKADALVRDILESLCIRGGLSLESAVAPGEPARNYQLAERLGIGHVFGLEDAEPQPAPGLRQNTEQPETRRRPTERHQRNWRKCWPFAVSRTRHSKRTRRGRHAKG